MILMAAANRLCVLNPDFTVNRVKDMGPISGGGYIYALAVDPSGNFYIAVNRKVYKLDSGLNLVTSWGTNGYVTTEFVYKSRGLALDSNGNLLVAHYDDYNQNYVSATYFNASGVKQWSVNVYGSPYRDMYACFFDDAGDCYVAGKYGAYKLSKIDGSRLVTYQTSDTIYAFRPVPGSTDVIVGDDYLKRYANDGTLLGSHSIDLDSPQAIAVKADGTVFIANRKYRSGSYNSVWRLDWSGSSFSIGASYYTGSYTYAIDLESDGNVVVSGSVTGGKNVWRLNHNLELQNSALPYSSYSYAILADVSVVEPLPAKATNPDPQNEAIDVNEDTDLQWTNGAGTETVDVYFDKKSEHDPPITKVVDNLDVDTYNPPEVLDYVTEYVWRVDCKNAQGTITGDQWSFTVRPKPFTPPVDKKYRKRIAAVAGGKFYYED